ncbi:hypothetical protein AB0M36_09485 [Actinoplanes sp. NPDC051346]|uniref:hypothetical protein n=1 Tax=Actinoplanes sp. NPDC051346 TaxID=3155048 RepID=UPI00342C2D8E
MQHQPDVFGPLQGGERALWRGRCAVAEYAFDRAASLPRWTLPESTEVLVTDRRIAYAYASSGSPEDLEIKSGDLRWLYPQHIRVQPGSRPPGRAASVTQIQLVCGGADGSFPALVFAGGDLTGVREADRLANIIRHAIARFRVDNADKLGLTTPQARMLSRLLIGPEFSNFEGGEGQTASLLGALPVPRPAAAEQQHPTGPAASSAGAPAAAEGAPVADYPAPVPTHAAHAAGPNAAHAAPDPAYPAPAAAHAGPVSAYPASAAAHAAPAAAHAASAAAHAAPAAAASPAASYAAPVPRGAHAAHAARVDAGHSGPDAGHPEPEHNAAASGGTGRLSGYRPGRAADEARALQAAAAEQAAHLSEPDLATRAASLAARVANLVAGLPEEQTGPRHSHQPTVYRAPTHQPAPHYSGAHQPTVYPPTVYQPGAHQPAAHEPTVYQPAGRQPTVYQPAAHQPAAQPVHQPRVQPIADHPIPVQPIPGHPIPSQPIAGKPIADHPIPVQPIPGQPIPGQPAGEQPTANLGGRAERVRRTAARFAANSGKGNAPAHRAEHESGTTPRGNR